MLEPSTFRMKERPTLEATHNAIRKNAEQIRSRGDKENMPSIITPGQR